MQKSVKGLGSGAGMGSLVGAGAGGLIGGVHRYSQRRREGASVGEAAAGSLGGAARGALRGAAVGAVGGGALGAARPGALKPFEEMKGLGAMSRFGQRQVHSLTGVGDKAYVRSIGGGASSSARELQEAAVAANTPGAGAKQWGELQHAQKAHAAAEKAEGMGLTSLPGYAKALIKDPKGALKAGFGEQWHASGPGGKALMFGLPVASAASELRKGEGEGGHKSGRFERAGEALGAGLGFAAGPLSVTGASVASAGLGKALGTVGKGVDRLAGRKGKLVPRHSAAPPTVEPGGSSIVPSDRVYSDRAMGAMPEMVG